MSGHEHKGGKRKPDAETLAAQLRANLKRRRQQARARQQAGTTEGEGSKGEETGGSSA